MTKHLPVPDPHVQFAKNLDVENRRFDALGQLIMDERPDVIVCLGDLGDCSSISRHNGKRDSEGLRWADEVAAVRDASRRILAPMRAYNAERKARKEKQYRPRLVMLMGNHDEGWLERWLNDHPEMIGFVDLSNFGLEEDGWELVPWRETVHIDGIAYSHHIAAGTSGRPIGGVNMARRLLKQTHTSVTVGHSHLFDIATETDARGRRLWGLSAGVFREDAPHYAKDTHQQWWRGVVVKENVQDGNYDPKFIGMSTLLKKYL